MRSWSGSTSTRPAPRASAAFGSSPAPRRSCGASPPSFCRIAEEHPSGADVIREGDSGDCWYLVTAGSVDVLHDGARVATLGPSDGFGEIALLSQQPRTATVRARDDLGVLRLPRPIFLEAVTGSAHAVLAGEQLVAQRLSELGHDHGASLSHEP